jgi:phosphoribosylformylglycinamidine synthase subunit PurL
MKAWELLLSESQERMLLIVDKGREAEVVGIFEKWDLPAAEIGQVTDDGLLRFYMNGELESEIPAHELVLGGGAPQYERQYSEPAYLKKVKAFDPAGIEVPDDLRSVAKQLIAIPNIASKKWVAVQYDSTVGTANSSTNQPSDAAVVLVKLTEGGPDKVRGRSPEKALAITTDCNSRYVFADPYKGAMIAVAEAARNIVCSGGQPLGVTNCLNFGNPYDPEVYYQFVHAIKGMGEACRKLDTPVTGGNVSFYNQNPDGAVYPTPTIGMVGVLDSVKDKMTLDFKEEGDIIFLLGKSNGDINSSEYLHKVQGVEFSPAPHFNMAEEIKLQHVTAELIKKKLVRSAHDISEGGLFVALAESAFPRELGFDVVASDFSIRKDGYWFGESQSRVVVSVQADKVAAFKAVMGDHPYEELGFVTKGSFEVDGMDWGNVGEWKDKYEKSLENYLDKLVEAD